MIPITICKKELDFLNLEGVSEVYKSAYLHKEDKKENSNRNPQDTEPLPANNEVVEEKPLAGAFVAYKGNDRRVRFSEKNYVSTDYYNAFSSLKGKIMMLNSLPLPENISDNDIEKLNELIASALAYAAYCDFTTSETYLKKANETYDEIVSRKETTMLLGTSLCVALLTLIAIGLTYLSVEASHNMKLQETWLDTCVKFLADNKDWLFAIEMGIIGVCVSICWNKKTRYIKRNVNSRWYIFLLDASIRYMLGIISAIIIILAIKGDWILSNLVHKNGENTNLYMLVGFVAGFSERQVTKLIGSISSMIGMGEMGMPKKLTTQEQNKNQLQE